MFMEISKINLMKNILRLVIYMLGFNIVLGDVSSFDFDVDYNIQDTLYLDQNGSVNYDEEEVLIKFKTYNDTLETISLNSDSITNFCNSLGSSILLFDLIDNVDSSYIGSLSLTVLDTISPICIIENQIDVYLDVNGDGFIDWDDININSFVHSMIISIKISTP